MNFYLIVSMGLLLKPIDVKNLQPQHKQNPLVSKSVETISDIITKFPESKQTAINYPVTIPESTKKIGGFKQLNQSQIKALVRRSIAYVNHTQTFPLPGSQRKDFGR